ncbi:MAG TPA: copper amine oxidase N-terminal domain-containing protein [Chthonomonadaceae bacterium]|nr:copper amine oxidase N-terminal domain-containing protein [Chthonomonadaceae bacterium]
MVGISYRHSARVVGVAAVMATMVWYSALGAAAQSRARTIRLDAGTVIPVRLDQTLSSNDSQQGDTFTATVRPSDGTGDNDYADYTALPVGTKVEGVVRTARPRSGKNPGVLDLDFRRVRLPDGRSYSIDGSLIGLDSKSVTRTKDGRLIAKPGHKTDRLTYVGYGAGAGLIIGMLTKRPLEDALWGAGLGYLYGALQKGNTEVKDVTLKPGTEFGVRLDRRLVLSDYRSEDYYNNREGTRSDDLSRYHRTGNTDNYDREANPTDIGVMIGDRNVRFDSTARPVMANSVVLVPVGPVLDASHISYRYDANRRELRASSDQGVVRVGLNSRIAVVNGNRRVRLEAPVQRLNGAIYVPMRFLELATGDRASWDPISRTVVLTPTDQGDLNAPEGER